MKKKLAFKYDPKSEYYTDDCNPYTTDNGTDIILIDRQNEFVNNNMSLCENGCEFEKYDEEKQMAICKCEIKNKQILISEILNDTNTLNNNFTTNYSSSFKMKCYHILFSKEGLEKNVESYILIFIIICFIILGILFQKCGYPMLNSDMKQIIEFKEENKNIHNNVNMNDTNDNKDNKKAKNCTEKEKNELMAIKQNIKKRDIKQSKVNPIQIDSKDNPNSFSKINIKNSQNLPFPKEMKNNLNSEPNSDSNITDYEINNYSYTQALKYDKRTFSDYYMSLIKTKHPLLFVFCSYNDYNSILIKLSIFLLYFSIIYTFNAIFFNEDIIHLIYEEGVYNIIHLLPEIVYSFIISHVLYLGLRYLFLSERNFIEIKKENIENAYDKMDSVRRCLIIKYLCFYVFGTLVLIFFWYFLSSFGAVYRNSQVHLIKNAFVTLAIAFVYPFIINL